MSVLTGAPSLALLLGAGGQRFDADGLRAEADDAGVRFARQRLLGSLLAAVDLGDAWVFVTWRGVVARSATFLGDVVRVGEAEAPARVQAATRGRLAIVAEGGALYVTDGRTVSAAGPTRAPVVVAAFASERFGAAVLTDGGLAATSDGGASWHDVDLGREAAFDVYCAPSALRVRTSRGWSALTPEHRLSPPEHDDGDSLLRAPPVADPASVAAVRAALRARSTDAPVDPAPRLADGTSVRLRRCVLEHVGRDGAVLAASTLSDDESRCELRPWGPAAAVLTDELYRTEDGESLSLVYPSSFRRGAPFAIDPARIHFASDGVHVAIERPCDPEPNDDDVRRRSACVLLDGIGAWREVALPTDQEVAGVNGARILLTRCADDGCRATVVDADAGDARPVTLAPRPDAVGAALLSAPRWTRDGALTALAGVGRGASAPRWLALGDPRAPLSLLPLRPGTIDVVFDDRTRGVAVGPHLGVVSRTLDGGRFWEAVDAPIEGSIAGARYDPSGSRCDAEGCVLSGWLSIRGWGAVRPHGDPWYSLSRATPADQGRDAGSPAGAAPWSPTRLRCASAGSPRPSPLPDAQGALASVWSAGEVRLVRGPRPHATTVTVAWAGDGLRRASASLPVGPDESPGSFVALGAGARGLLLSGPRGLVATWAARAEPVAFDALAWGFRSHYTDPSGQLVLPTTDGGAALALSGMSDAYPVTVTARITPDGRLGASRAFRTREGPWGLGRVRDGYAFVERLADGRLRASPLDGGPAEVLAALPTRLPICAGAPPRDAALVTWAVPPALPLVAIDELRVEALHAEVAITPTGACLHGVAARGAWEPHPLARRFVLRASRGRLEGFGDEPGAHRALRCEVTP